MSAKSISKVIKHFCILSLTYSSYGLQASYNDYDDDYLDRSFRSLGTSQIQHNRPSQYAALSKRSLTLAPTPNKVVEEYHEPIENNKVKLSPSITIPNASSWLKSVEDQGQLGTCASFTATECLKYTHEKNSLSQAYIIVKAEQSADCLNNGLAIGTAMKTAVQTGTIGQSWWKYPDYVSTVKRVNKDKSNDSEWDVCMRIPYDKTQESELVKYAFTDVKNLFQTSHQQCKQGDQQCEFDKSDDIKAALKLYKSPIAIATTVKNNDDWDRSGQIFSENGSNRGFHAITIYGYNDQDKAFHFKNSWGPQWGSRGLGKISYSYVQKHVSEAWVGIGKELKS